MVINTIQTSNCTPQTIVIGRRGTYDTLQVVFDLTYLIDTYGDGVAVLAVKRSQDESAYPAVTTQEESILTWTISETDTAYVGSGECQLMWYVDGGLAKTIIYPMVVMRDILSTAETPPDGYQTWVDNLTALGAETLQNAQDAAQSASEAKVSEDNTEESAQRAEEAAEMLTNVSATATTLEPGQEATAEYDDGVFEFGIPKGPKGDKLTYADLTEADKADLVQGPIKEAQDTAVDAVDEAKRSAVSAVNEAGTTQVGNVNTAGTTQVAAVEDKGEEVLESIPQDYTELANDVADLNQQLSDLTDVVSTTQIINSASGAIASFDDGADGMPVRKLVANIEPVQDLNGYDSPWPAGGGKNKLDSSTVPTGTKVGVTITRNSDGTVTVNGTANGNLFDRFTLPYTLPVGQYIFSGCPSGGSTSTYAMQINVGTTIYYDTGSGVQFAVEDEGVAISITLPRLISGAVCNNLLFKPMIRLATETDATFTPYSNICPISGHTGAEVTQTGKNLLPKGEDKTASGITFTVQDNGEVVVTGTATATVFWGVQFTIPAGTYVLNGCPSGGGGSSYYVDVRNNVGGSGISGISADTGNGSTFTLTEELTAYVNIRIASGYAAPSGGLKISPMIRLTSESDATFEPYTGDQISVTFPTEAGTVYGGTLTINPDRTGELVVTHGSYTFSGNEEWTRYEPASGVQTYNSGNRFPPNLNTNGVGIMSRYPFYKTSYIGGQRDKSFCFFSTPTLSVRDNSYSDATAFAESMAGAVLVYELATPITYQLTESEISGILETIYGTNNIWADTGDTEATYPADTKLYIDGKIAEAIAALNA